LNTDNPGVREYIFGVARHWLEFGIDGWRLDVPYEIDDDAFWQEFRRVVKSANPEAYICGELWKESQRWLQGDQFDAVMNYIFMSAALSFCGFDSLNPNYNRDLLELEPLDAPAFAAEMDRMHALYDWEVTQVQLNLLDSHDTARALWILSDDIAALRLCVLLQMTLPGAPCIYYGDEVGLSAGDDPYCRGAFPWNNEDSWNRELLDFYQQATALRHQHPPLRTGEFQSLYAEGQVYAFSRTMGGQEAVVVLNSGSASTSAEIPLHGFNSTEFRQVWPYSESDELRVNQNQLDVTVPAQSAFVLVT
jgi:neopullulanase